MPKEYNNITSILHDLQYAKCCRREELNCD